MLDDYVFVLFLGGGGFQKKYFLGGRYVYFLELDVRICKCWFLWREEIRGFGEIFFE